MTFVTRMGMNRNTDKILLTFFTVFYIVMSGCAQRTVIPVLTAVICAGAGILTLNTRYRIVSYVLAAAAAIAGRPFECIAIYIVYDMVSDTAYRNRRECVMGIAGIILIAVRYMMYPGIENIIDDISSEPVMAVILSAGIFAAVYIAWIDTQYEITKRANIRMRDDTEEFRRNMTEKNKLLRMQQDNEIAVATLSERNRIAREIHDNVGHLLSRAIIQMGALRTINTDKNMAAPLEQISATLSESMDNIRKSVHDLHSESVNLEQKLRDEISKEDNCDVRLNYDVINDMPVQAKYSVISIVSEALHNISRHSDATRADVTVTEHPAFYQIVIKDNGHPAAVNETGIGIHNMEARINELGGTFMIDTHKGFRIFATIPIKERN